MHTNRQLNVKVSIGLEDAKSKLVFGINNPVHIDHGSTTLSYAHFLNLNNDRILKLYQKTSLEILNKKKFTPTFCRHYYERRVKGLSIR